MRSYTLHYRMAENNNLKVYRASAGSGKTFTLVSEYIALAISPGTDTSSFAGILAITFTNKATGEMKMRILNTLWNVWRNEGDNAGYVDTISGMLGGKLGEDEIRRRCGVTLRCIVNNYDFFDVKTIDSFFQGIVSDIAAMIGFNSNLEVFLNDSEAISMAVDNIVRAAAEGENKSLAALLKDYIERNLDDNTTWDFRRALKQFGRNVCMEAYMRNEEKINRVFGNGKAFGEIYNSIVKEKKTAEAMMAHLGDNLTIDYSLIARGKNLQTYVEKAKTGKLEKESATVNNFLAGKYGKLRTTEEQMEIWRLQYAAFEKDRLKLYRKLNSAELTLKNLNEMRMLEAIDSEVKRQSREENRILLSKSQELVDEQLRDGDSMSFVFERAGRRYRHIMLDEAQDTSHMQFDNLWKLISNQIATAGNRSVVVGDVKQSIYRWRGGDWNILHNLGKTFDPDNHNSLKDNYRSYGNVVEFNNEVFRNISIQQGGKIESIYSDVVQNVKSRHKGEGCITIDVIDEDKEDVEEKRLELLLRNIENAHNAGVDYSDMAILTRKNREICKIADYAEEHEAPFRINTHEAYSLSNSVAVETIISALKFAWGEVTSNPDNVSGFLAAREYQRQLQGSGFEEPVFEEKKSQSLRLYIEQNLPRTIVHDAARIAELPIAEAVMRTAQMLDIVTMKDESQYLFTFFDYINAYAQRNAYDWERFFDDWETGSATQYIPMGTADGIKAMTIHKAKGLEFHTVFVPYCDWKFVSKNDNVIWCGPQDGVYEDIPLVPIAIGKKTQNSVYENEYCKEMLEMAVDNLNMLYVAFTRAKANLMIEYSAPKEDNSNFEKTAINDWLDAAVSQIDMKKYNGNIAPGEKENFENSGGRFSFKGNVVELEINMDT